LERVDVYFRHRLFDNIAGMRKADILPPLGWRKLSRFRALAPDEKWIFVQAWFLLGWFRATVPCVSFKRLTAGLEHRLEIPAPLPLSGSQQALAVTIGRLVAVAARSTPWKSPCLAQVLVAQKLLARRNIPGQFYLGVKRGCEQADDPAGLSAHAWLQCGGTIVNGEPGSALFTVVSTFRWGVLAV